MRRVALDTFAFEVCGQRFRWMLRGKQLWCEGSIIAEGVTSARTAVDMAKGFNIALQEIKRIARLSEQQHRESVERGADIRAFWDQQERRYHEQQ